jgi:hypothetical protein
VVEGGFTGYTLAARVKLKLEEDLQRVFLNIPIKKFVCFYNKML